MKEQKVQIINKLGLHARAAASLVKLTNEYRSEITMIKDGNRANAKNIMEVLMLAATQETHITIITNGPDEAPLMNAVVGLINDRFYESE